MASIHRFEDIEAWQEARKLTKAVYGVTRRRGNSLPCMSTLRRSGGW